MNLCSLRLWLPLIFLVLLMQACKTPERQAEYDMDMIGNYSDLWKKVDSLQQKALVRSALDEVLTIKEHARKASSSDQLIKAIIIENKLLLQLEEDGLSRAIGRVLQEMHDAPMPAKAILSSYLGELYYMYLQRNHWKLGQRTPQADTPTEIEKMSVDDLMLHAADAYLFSIRDRSNLTQPLSDFTNILIDPSQSLESELKASIYQLLVVRALNHFEFANSFISQPQRIFAIDHPDFFLPREEFINLKLDTVDTASTSFLATKVFQLGLVEPDLTLDLRRLNFMLQKSTEKDKNDHYIMALETLRSAYPDPESLATISFHLASFYHRTLSDYKTAYSLCMEVISKFAGTKSSERCSNLIDIITRPHLQIQVEEVVIPGQDILINIRFKNLSNVYGRLIRLQGQELPNFENLNQQSQLEIIRSLESEEELKFALPSTDDFKDHSTEVKLDNRKPGGYILLMSSSPQFDDKSDIVVVAQFDVSNLTFVQENSPKGPSLICLSRTDGHRLRNVKVEWFAHEYDRQQRRQIRTKVFESFSNEDGFAEVPSNSRLRYTIRLSKDLDTLHLNNHYIRTYTYPSNQGSRREVKFYTDRAIYRPGQMIFFKGIILDRAYDGKATIQPNTSVTVTFYDANGQVIEHLERVSNAYGSFEGQFTIPNHGLLGRMSLGSNLGSTRFYFPVEAYKRPTFEITFDSLDIAYKLGERIEISGSVFSFAGAAIGKAPVKYRVVRKSRFPYYRSLSRFPYPQSSSREIASGVTTTDEAGLFTTSFVAIPDEEIDAKLNPVFEYLLFVEATDLTGETQGLEMSMSLGYQPYGLRLQNDPVVDLTEVDKLVFEAKSIDGQTVKVQGSATIKLLKGPKKWLRKRYWQDPDLPSGVSEHPWYESIGRNLEFDTLTLGVLPLVEDQNQLVVDFSALDLIGGRYQVITSTSSGSADSIESTFEIDLINHQESYVPSDQLLSILQKKETYQPGDTATIWIGSPVESQVYFRIERESSIDVGNIQIRQGWQKVDIPLREEDRGDIHLHLFTTFQNRIQTSVERIAIPWTNKNLSVEIQTIRDRTLPRADEKVSLNIQNHLGIGVESEVLVTMFDASLDALVRHKWALDYFPLRLPLMQFTSGGFRSVYARQLGYGTVSKPRNIRDAKLPGLNWFGFPIAGPYRTATDRVMRSSKMQDEVPATAEMQESSVVNEEQNNQVPPAPREDFSETLFFYPQLQSEDNGSLTFDYQMNDALTRWRMMILAHRKDGSLGYQETNIISQKKLMVSVNRPRFLRAGDEIRFGGKVDNLTEYEGGGKYQSIADKCFNRRRPLSLLPRWAFTGDLYSCKSKLCCFLEVEDPG